MTDNRIPHWMTEGLAVWEEHAPLRWEWVPMLYRAVTKDELFTLDNLTWGFVLAAGLKWERRQLAFLVGFAVFLVLLGVFFWLPFLRVCLPIPMRAGS